MSLPKLPDGFEWEASNVATLEFTDAGVRVVSPKNKGRAMELKVSRIGKEFACSLINGEKAIPLYMGSSANKAYDLEGAMKPHLNADLRFAANRISEGKPEALKTVFVVRAENGAMWVTVARFGSHANKAFDFADACNAVVAPADGAPN